MDLVLFFQVESRRRKNASVKRVCGISPHEVFQW